MSLQTAVAGVVAKSGYASLSVNAIGQQTSRALFETELSLWWQGEFSDFTKFGGPNGYVEPTTKDLQRLYDATVGSNGDPMTISAVNFKILVLDLILETATDPRWQPYLTVKKWAANDTHNAYDVEFVKTLEKAFAGIPESNYVRDSYITNPVPGTVLSSPLASVTNSLPVSVITKEINDLYIGYFNRAPEFGGLKLWSGVLEKLLASGKSFDESLTDVANQFWGPASVDFSHLTGYTTGMGNAEFVTKVYSNVLGRPDAAVTDQSGINGWVHLLDTGDISSRGSFIVKITDAAYDYIAQHPTEAVSQHVLGFLTNRSDIGLFFAQEKYSGSLTGDAAVVAGMAALANITDNTASVAAAMNNIKSGAYLHTGNIEATITMTGQINVSDHALM